MDLYRLLPWFWSQECETCLMWDKRLNELLDKYEPELNHSGHTVRLGNFDVWVENYPYSYGTLHSDKYTHLKGLPKVKTRIRLKKILDAQREKIYREKREKELALFEAEYYNVTTQQ